MTFAASFNSGIRRGAYKRRWRPTRDRGRRTVLLLRQFPIVRNSRSHFSKRPYAHNWLELRQHALKYITGRITEFDACVKGCRIKNVPLSDFYSSFGKFRMCIKTGILKYLLFDFSKYFDRTKKQYSTGARPKIWIGEAKALYLLVIFSPFDLVTQPGSEAATRDQSRRLFPSLCFH